MYWNQGDGAGLHPARLIGTLRRPNNVAGVCARAREQLDDDLAQVLLELDVEERPPAGRRQDLGQGRDTERLQGRGTERADTVRAPVRPLERRVVTDDRDAVGRRPHVELEAVAGRDGQRCREGGDRVSGAWRRSPRWARRSVRAGTPLPDLELRGDAE